MSWARKTGHVRATLYWPLTRSEDSSSSLQQPFAEGDLRWRSDSRWPKSTRILTLHKAGHSNREIAALLGMNRETVGKHLGQVKAQNQPNAPTGNEAGNGPADAATESQPNAPTDSASSPANGPPSECEALEEIVAKIEQGMEAVRIHQGLVVDHRDSTPSYYSVRRFIARLRQKDSLPFRRMETGPGEEAQVDFGSGAEVRTSEGKVRRPWIFRIVLS